MEVTKEVGGSKAMRVFIIGCGRSGTNLLYQMVRLSGQFAPSNNIEDRDIFNFRELPPHYMTKIAIERLVEEKLIFDYMERYSNLVLIFSFRHPYDVIASKVYRGRPKSQGGDNSSEEYMSDADPLVACELINKNWNLWQALAGKYPDRVNMVKLEDILTDTDKTVMRISKFLKVGNNKKMFTPWRYNTNAYHQERYKNRKANQVNLWANPESWGGYFKDFDFTRYNKKIEELANYFHYELN